MRIVADVLMADSFLGTKRNDYELTAVSKGDENNFEVFVIRVSTRTTASAIIVMASASFSPFCRFAIARDEYRIHDDRTKSIGTDIRLETDRVV